MITVNIIIMGQTGNGKSTIVNTIMGKDVAPTGQGERKTTENKIYSVSCRLGTTEYKLSLFDTVGLEVSEKSTQKTLKEVREYLTKRIFEGLLEDSITLVWFCVNSGKTRFEDYEVDLIRKLSFEYEIPFLVVLTKCLDDQMGRLEKCIHDDLPEIRTIRILAQDYVLRGGAVVPAFGIDELLGITLTEYDGLKVRVLEKKLEEIQSDAEIGRWYIEQLEERAKKCVEKYRKKTSELAWIPIACIPFIHGLCVDMAIELNKIYGLPLNEGFIENFLVSGILGVIATPLMIIPVLSMAAADSYIKVVGDTYVETFSSALKGIRYCDLKNAELIALRIKKELSKREK